MGSIKGRGTKKCHRDPRVTVDAIHTEHIKTLTDEELNEYFLDNGILLDKYYGSSDNSPEPLKKKSTKKSKILQYFPSSEEEIDTSSVSHIQQYIENIDDTTLDTGRLTIQMDKCPLCRTKMNIHYSKSDIICYGCGYSESIIIHS